MSFGDTAPFDNDDNNESLGKTLPYYEKNADTVEGFVSSVTSRVWK